MKKLKALFSSIILILFILNNLMPIISFAIDNTYNEKSTEQVTAQEEQKEEIGRVYEIKEEET